MEGADAPLPLPCPYHGVDVACDRCPARYETDGYLFPHRQAVPKGVTRKRHCPSCGELVTPEQWDKRPTPPFGLSRGQCLQCSAEDATPEPAAAPAAEAAPAKLSRRR